MVARRLALSAELAGGSHMLRFVSGERQRALAERLLAPRVRDVLFMVPKRYIDLTGVVPVLAGTVGSDVTVVVEVDRVVVKRPRPKLTIIEASCFDESGVILLVFFNMPWLEKQLTPGTQLIAQGTLKYSYGFRRLESPVFEVVEEGELPRVLPVYGLTQGMSIAWMRRIISEALADRGNVIDPLPPQLVAARQLMARKEALRALHFPRNLQEAERARQRFAYEELLLMQLMLAHNLDERLWGTKHTSYLPPALAQKTRSGSPLDFDTCVSAVAELKALRAALPFEPTNEQKVAVAEIITQLAAPKPANHLVQGDVGTGKTAVAALVMSLCAHAQTQAAMMAPTSVLAAQYAQSAGMWLDAAGISWALLTSATPQAERATIVEGLASGEICVAFGTTALLSDDVVFKRLSLAIIDEQHRFGVQQRGALRQKGLGVDVVALSATPIPRTLALSVYGDISMSILRTRPKSTAPTTTRVLTPENMDIAWGALKEALSAGHQAYVVVPLVEQAPETGREVNTSDPHTAQASVRDEAAEEIPELFETTSPRMDVAQALRELSCIVPEAAVLSLNGRMKPEEKDEIMAAFKAKEADILVSTTVVEVGVDVPNATFLLVYNGDSFGLATLHQLRGRVGRGDVAGTCFIHTTAKRGTPARKRLSALERTQDGFKLAELDLSLRREGNVLGYKQAGRPSLRFADLAQDMCFIEFARHDAQVMLAQDPQLTSAQGRVLHAEMEDIFTDYLNEFGHLPRS